MVTHRFVVRGFVQGVCFRHATVREAERLGVRGWVRNREDGGVEVHAQGGEDALRRFAEFLGRGPAHARVAGVEHGEFEGPEAYRDFRVAF